MTWNPTHVQLTVLRARNLPTKGKGGAKLNDVFVTLQLSKDKFQTSTIKNAVNPEWFEQCDLTIPHMHSEIQIQVMHRGMLSDDFIGYAAIPLAEYKLYERPKSQWLQLRGKPHKPPDNKNRGELEVRITFQVKSKTEDPGGAGMKSSKKSPKLKALASVVGHKVGDKLKFTRSRSLRDNRNDPEQSHYKTTRETIPPSHSGLEDSPNESSENFTGTDFTADHQVAPLSNNNPVNFSAIDINQPPQWKESALNERMARSYSVSLDRNRPENENDDSTAQYNIHMPGNRRSLPPSYWGTQTLPHPRSKRSVLSEDTFQRSADDLNTSVSSQPGYLEAMFHKEREVYKQMQGLEHDSTDESGGFTPKQRKNAKEYIQEDEHSYDSDSEGSVDIKFPAVKRKQNYIDKQEQSENVEFKNELEETGSSSRTLNESDGKSLERQISKESKDSKSITETSFPEDSIDPVYHSPRQEDNQVVPSAENQVNGEREVIAPPRHKKKIALEQQFLFGNSPDKPDGNVRRRSKRDKLRQLYKQGGRRYTVQGLEVPRRKSYGDSLSSILDFRPQFARELSVPEDLITVYRNMTKEELIHMVITHKAQLIRKDQYIKDLEDYIDKMLVRVMESDPRLLQHPTRRF